MNHKYMFGCLATLVCFFVGQRPALAIEPIDNTAPWAFPNYNNVSTYIAVSTSSGWGVNVDQAISSSTDTDYLMAVCAVGNITQLWVSFAAANGDLDMRVYKPGGAYVGGSFGVGSDEKFDASSLNRNALVMQIYGYGGATNSYSVIIGCTSS